MRKSLVTIAALSLLTGALACGPATQSGGPGPTTDAIPAPTNTTAPATEPPAETGLPPAPTQDGSGAGGTPITSSGDTGTLEGFRQTLLDNIISRNFGFLLYTMDDPFTISAWRAGGGEMTPAEATTKLQTDLLPADNIVHYDLDKDVTALMDGTTPQQMFGGNTVIIVDAVFMDGWGADGKGEAIIFISQSPEGVFAWHALIIATQGFN